MMFCISEKGNTPVFHLSTSAADLASTHAPLLNGGSLIWEPPPHIVLFLGTSNVQPPIQHIIQPNNMPEQQGMHHIFFLFIFDSVFDFLFSFVFNCNMYIISLYSVLLWPYMYSTLISGWCDIKFWRWKSKIWCPYSIFVCLFNVISMWNYKTKSTLTIT